MRLIFARLRSSKIALLAGSAAIVALTIFATLPGDSRFLQALQNTAHAPAFALLAFLIIELSRTTARSAASATPRYAASATPRYAASATPRYAVTLVACLLIGIAIELIQGSLGRDSSAMDVLTDMLGSASGLSLYACFDPRLAGRSTARIVLLGMSVISVCLAAAPLAKAAAAYAHRMATFPVLAEFNSSLDLYFLDDAQTTATAAILPAPWATTAQEKALYVSLGAQHWPGVSLEEPSPDWSGYRNLCVDLVNPSPAALPLNIRVHDRLHNQRMADRFNLGFTVAAHSRQTLRIPLLTIQRSPQGRSMDMRRIDGITVFGEGPYREAASFYLVRIWLD